MVRETYYKREETLVLTQVEAALAEVEQGEGGGGV